MPAALEETLGYHFQNQGLLHLALTHPSLAYELDQRASHNQRLEFLGDAALQLSLSTLLYERYPSADEGELTKLRASLVSTHSLAELARSIQLGEELKMGRGECSSGGRSRESALADALEAVLGAIYLDGGVTALQSAVLKLFSPIIESKEQGLDQIDSNPKGKLQEIIQSHTCVLPVYTIVSEEGPPHNRQYQAQVSWQNVVLGTGCGPTKKHAEIQAAKSALESNVLNQVEGLGSSSQLVGTTSGLNR